jgi:Skp family chaperone for outer membrane proteins
MTQVTYKSEKIATKRVYYTGQDVLGEGYCLCYNRDAGTASEADLARAYEVEKPATGNLQYFAGVVAAEDAGRAGPCWISIIEPQPNPGRLVKLHTDQDCTLGSTKLAVQDGSYAAGAAGPSAVAVATAMQTIDRSGEGNAGTVLAQLEGASSVQIDVAAAVSPAQAALTKATGSTTGGTHTLQTAALTTTAMGGTTGGTVSLENVTGLTAAPTGQLENNFAKFAGQLVNIRKDLAKLVTELNAAKIDVAAVITAMKNANLMAS